MGVFNKIGADGRKKADKFLDALVRGNLETAYEDILQGSVIRQKKKEVDVLKKQTAIVLETYGKTLGYDLVKDECYGESMQKLIYILVCEHFPVTWEFYFYKAKNEWSAVSIKFNDQFDLLK